MAFGCMQNDYLINNYDSFNRKLCAIIELKILPNGLFNEFLNVTIGVNISEIINRFNWIQI